MRKHIVFIQGGGEDGYAADTALVDSFRTALGSGYAVDYPELHSDDSLPDFGWTKQIADKIFTYKNDLMIIAHSFGASLLLKYISENSVPKHVTGIFLLATPFWKGDEDWQKSFTLRPGFANHLPNDIPLYFYHCQDDAEVPFSQFEQYRKQIKQARFHESKTGGHQFDTALERIVADVESIS